MSKLLSLLVAIGVAGASISVVAMEDMKSPGMLMDMNAMDTNHDGMISKKEFMKYHEDMWAKMKKNKAGMVDIKDMQMMHGGTMNDGMMKDGTMKDGMMKDGTMKDGTMKDGTMKDGTMKDKGKS
jgi:EF hand